MSRVMQAVAIDLANKAKDATEPHHAMQFGQAALNVANAARVTDDIPPGEHSMKAMVDRFLQWKLPSDFAPDAGISFDPNYNQHTPFPGRHGPTGTNLLTAAQAEAMIDHILGITPAASSKVAPPANR